MAMKLGILKIINSIAYLHQKYALNLKSLKIKQVIFPPTGKPWFEEAVSRGHLKPIVPSITYCFTVEGYNKALSIKKPFNTFWSKYWQWAIPTTVALLGILSNLILNLMKSQ